MSSPYLQEASKQLDLEIESTKGHLVKGSFTDLAEYKFVCGQLRGLELAKHILQTVVKKVNGDDDD
jgi:hypothetical protein